jgi:hypothetical protein
MAERMIKAKFSMSFQAKVGRIRRLPRFYERSMDASRKRDAVGFIEMFRWGIEGNQFKLAKLAESTVQAKRSAGMPQPTRPLYGRGPLEKNSYMNMLRLYKTSDGYRVRVKPGMHWSKGVTLKALLEIHENGATFTHWRTGKPVRIPARPAFSRARSRYLKGLEKQEPAEEVRKAIRSVLRTGSATPVSRFVKKADAEAKRARGR